MNHPSGKRRAELAIPAAMIALAVGAFLLDRPRPAPARQAVAPPAVLTFPSVLYLLGADGVSFDRYDPMASPEVREYDELSRTFVAGFGGNPDTVLMTIGAMVAVGRSEGLATTAKDLLRDVPPAIEAMRRRPDRAGSRPSFEAFLAAYQQHRRDGTANEAAIGKALERAWKP
jgi:hypothetical protein